MPYLLAIVIAGAGVLGVSRLRQPRGEETTTEQAEPPEEPETIVEEGITMIKVKGGTFTMGCQEGRDTDCRDDEKPAHSVTLSDFYIGKYEVTVKEFAAFIAATNYQTDADRGDGSYVWTGSEWKLTKGVNWKCDTKGSVRPANEYNHPVIHVS